MHFFLLLVFPKFLYLFIILKYIQVISKFINRYLSIRVLPIWIILFLDTAVLIGAVLLSFILRFDVPYILNNSLYVAKTIGIVVLFNIILFKVFRTYSNVIRFSSFVDVGRQCIAVTLAFGCVILTEYISRLILDKSFFQTSVLIIAYVISCFVLISMRMTIKTVFELVSRSRSGSKGVFVYGAKEAGVNIAKSIRIGLKEDFKLRGFIADEPELIGKMIMGVEVYANDENILRVLAEKDVNCIIVSPAKVEKLKDLNLIDVLLDSNIRLLTAPPLSDWNQSTLSSSEIKEIQIEDLLQREPIQVDLKKISSHLEGKRVLITGAAGSIGSEIMRQVVQFNPYSLILVDQAETPLHDLRLELLDKWRNVVAETIVADVTNESRMEAIFEQYKPQYIFHAAAYKHVPMMEDNVSESIQVNIRGTKIVADLAVKYGVSKFVMVSTDKAVNPSNVMGCSKRIAEIYVQSLARKLAKEGNKSVSFITTRFGNVLGSNGSVIPRFKEQIRKGGPVTVTHKDIIRYFMTIPEACRLVLEAGSMGNGGEIYIFDMGEPVKIYDLAKRMISLSGCGNSVKIVFTGLRHGEKLYEELLNVKELTKPTYHHKIMIAHVREYDYDRVNADLEELYKLSFTYNSMAIVQKMKDIVPEFISKNSVFDQLDKAHEAVGEALDKADEELVKQEKILMK